MKMNKKLITMLAALGLVGCVGVGSTLAYLTDTTDVTKNVFTVGKVDVEVIEDFTQGSLIAPRGTVYVRDENNEIVLDENGNPETKEVGDVKKEIRIENTGKNDAYVRLFIAIPNAIDDGDPTLNPANNLLHFNFTDDSLKYWSWNVADGSKWNYYEEKIDGVDYNVYVVTYMEALKPEEKTKDNAIWKVYLESKVTSETIEEANEKLGNGDAELGASRWKILVAAQAVQADNFEENAPFLALNKAFGLPSSNSPFKGEITKKEASKDKKNNESSYR